MEVEELSYEDLVKIKEERKLTKEENKRWRSIYSKRYNAQNKNIVKQAIKYKNNRDKILFEVSSRNKNYRKSALDKLGNSKCQICGITDIEKLTIDHINGGGRKSRKLGFTVNRLCREISQDRLSESELRNLRVLCWNHNCGRNRLYLDLPQNKKTSTQKYQTKLWKMAFDFFGPCRCGETELKFLTISHIHNDGAKRRKEGEKYGWNLLSKFNKAKWPKSLKEVFRLECFNCNCSRGDKAVTSISPLNSAESPD